VPKPATPRLAAVADGLLDWGLETFVYVPSSHSAPVIRNLLAAGVRAVMANREDEAVAVASGLVLSGRRAAIVMQDNGFGNALTALTTLSLAYHVGLPIVANSRGGLGEYNAMIQSISARVPDLLAAAGVRVFGLGPSDPVPVWRRTVSSAAELAGMQRAPIVTLFDALHPALEVAP
jgi:sulfopyruvate decarboxylase subunit alpha